MVAGYRCAPHLPFSPQNIFSWLSLSRAHTHTHAHFFHPYVYDKMTPERYGVSLFLENVSWNDSQFREIRSLTFSQKIWMSRCPSMSFALARPPVCTLVYLCNPPRWWPDIAIRFIQNSPWWKHEKGWSIRYDGKTAEASALRPSRAFVFPCFFSFLSCFKPTASKQNFKKTQSIDREWCAIQNEPANLCDTERSFDTERLCKLVTYRTIVQYRRILRYILRYRALRSWVSI